MAGILNKFGAHAGSAVDAVVIASTAVVGNRAIIEEFGASMEDTGADGRFRLQVSTDGFALDIRTKAQIVMPVGGTFLKTYGSPLVVQPGESFRVVSRQLVPAEVSSELSGKTDYLNIQD